MDRNIGIGDMQFMFHKKCENFRFMVISINLFTFFTSLIIL
ncbi:hypothetical protein ROSINTL182_09324 [Roseburia intestinalis L1-82]|uniref:Uncharacterized protein n=1 Tax=Roseburia intestinalis L1-82 TaxID=536231 RepID=C7GHA3_9FIRM|nr:hypothetical protein ROSINTL182_09324 [Roseburia intestinalis L1-82]